MSYSKNFKIDPENIKELIIPMGGCIASDRILVDGCKVGFMYREEPDFEGDSGWRFMSGDEDDEYLDDPNNSGIYDVNVIANYDEAIIDFLRAPVGIDLERTEEGSFRQIN